MVSEDIHSYKSNTNGYSGHSITNTSNLSGVKRFVDSSLRPWPPMYRSATQRGQMGVYQSLNPISSAIEYNYNHFNNGNYEYTNSAYGRGNKFNLHQLNMVSTASVIDDKFASATNLSNIKKTRNYHALSQSQNINNDIQPLQLPQTAIGNSGSFYGRIKNDDRLNNGNMLLMVSDRDKSRFRRLRNPTQMIQPFRSSCATCIRSKSMEDVRSEIATDWHTYNKENYNEFKRNRLNNGGPLGLLKNDVRRSMDNLLEAETSFGKTFQVCAHHSIRRLFKYPYEI